jgi:hypothetical protein
MLAQSRDGFLQNLLNRRRNGNGPKTRRRFDRQGVEGRAMSRASTTSVSVYNGRERLGTVDRRGNDFVAINTAGTVIGTFETQRQAIDALGEVRR